LNANKAIIFSHGKRMQMNTNCGWKFLLWNSELLLLTSHLLLRHQETAKILA
jgi:hypothetical protein